MSKFISFRINSSKMRWVFFFMIELIRLSLSNNDADCYFTVLYSNGSRSWCLDEECYNHVDIISIEDRQCRTNYLSLKFSSYSKYLKLLHSSSSRIPLSSFFSLARLNIERLLQIEFISPLDNDNPFKLDQFHLLTGPRSNIDTYELIFNGNLTKDNIILYIDRDMFMSTEQQYIDTLRLIFNCTNSQRVEWELIKSIEILPDSPCPQQINYLNKNLIKNEKCFNIPILISVIAFLSIIIVLIIFLFLFNYNYDHRLNEQSRSNSRTELITIMEKF